MSARNCDFAWFAASASERAARSRFRSAARSSARLRSETSRSDTEKRRLSFPLRVDDAELRGHGRLAGANDFDVRAVAGDDWKAEISSAQLVGAAAEQLLGRLVGEPNDAVGVDDHDAVGQPIDDRS